MQSHLGQSLGQSTLASANFSIGHPSPSGAFRRPSDVRGVSSSVSFAVDTPFTVNSYPSNMSAASTASRRRSTGAGLRKNSSTMVPGMMDPRMPMFQSFQSSSSFSTSYRRPSTLGMDLNNCLGGGSLMVGGGASSAFMNGSFAPESSMPHYTLHVVCSDDAATADAPTPGSARTRSFGQVLDAADYEGFDGPGEVAVVLGRGVSATVEKMVRKMDGKVVAVKHIEAVARQHQAAINRELFVAEQRREIPAGAASLNDALHLVDYYGAYSTPNGASIVMEIMAGCFGGLPPIPERVVSTVAKMFLRGLRFMHEELHVIHRDLKPSNLLFDAEGTLKITDFGLCTRLDSLHSTTDNYVGSQMFMSPERLRGEQYGYAGDVFSLGVTLAQMLMGQHPLTDSLGEAMTGPFEVRFWGLCGAMRINDGIDVSVAATQLSFRIALAPHCSPCMLDFILRCVHADPSKRPTCAELLRHAFVRPSPADGGAADDDDGGDIPVCPAASPSSPSNLLAWLRQNSL
jgi:serine/threonine protein kinase